MKRLSDLLDLIGLLALLVLLSVLVPSTAAAGGFERPPAVTPNTACGSFGIGRDANTFAVVQMQQPGQRVDSTGTWVACERPCPGTEALKTWTVDGYTCTSLERDRTILHGLGADWRQEIGPTRGVLFERCNDGARTVSGATCAPAATCATEFKVEREGAVYVYDGRPEGAAVAVGKTVDAKGPGGKTWPVTCDAGSWTAPIVLATPAAPPASAGAGPTLYCGAQAFNSGPLGRSITWRYDGQRVSAGAEVAVRSTGGLPGVARCGADARFVLLRIGR